MFSNPVFDLLGDPSAVPERSRTSDPVCYISHPLSCQPSEVHPFLETLAEHLRCADPALAGLSPSTYGLDSTPALAIDGTSWMTLVQPVLSKFS